MLALAAPVFGQSQNFPRGNLRIIVPVSPGGAADLGARVVAAELEKSLNKSVMVDNRPGGLFQLGMQAVMQAPADGHTLIHLHNSLASVQVVQKLFDLNKQLTPLTLNMETPMVLLVPGNSPFNTVTDLVSHARDNPGKINYSSLGAGSIEHLKSAQLEKIAGFEAMMIPYRGGAEAIQGLISNQVDFTLTAAIWGMNFASQGQCKILAIFDPVRWEHLPDVPTMAEMGLNVPPLRFWGGFAVRADTPAPLVERLHKELVAAGTAPGVAEKIRGGGMDVAVSRSPDEFRQLLDEEVRWMTEIADELNLQLG